jgi:hypothetical protein
VKAVENDVKLATINFHLREVLRSGIAINGGETDAGPQ